jgi:hypothetical protein
MNTFRVNPGPKIMLKKTIAPLLIGSVVLFSLGPSKTFAQTTTQPKTAESEHIWIDTRVEPKLDFKAAFSKEMANVKARTLTLADYERIEKQQQAQASRKGWTKGEKIGLVVIIGVVTAFTIAVLIRGINTTPSCVDDPFATNCT